MLCFTFSNHKQKRPFVFSKQSIFLIWHKIKKIASICNIHIFPISTVGATYKHLSSFKKTSNKGTQFIYLRLKGTNSSYQL